MRKGLLFLILSILIFSIAYGDDGNGKPSFYEPLIRRLVQDGFDPGFLSKLLTDPRAESVPHVMTISFSSGENPNLYAKFLTPESISLSKKFLHENLQILNRMEK